MIFDSEATSSFDSRLQAAWLRALAGQPRQIATPGAAAAVSMVKDVLSGYVPNVNVQSFKFDESITFYNSTRIQMEAYRIKPLTFDGIFLLAVIGYLFALYVMLRGFSGTIADVKAFIRGTRSAPASTGGKAKRS